MEKRDALAEYAHEAWSGWMKHLFKMSNKTVGGHVIIPSAFVERWERQINTEYKNLPKNEKESDLKEADKMLSIMNGR